ncbi:MAG: TonB-dependent receptor [Bacteroidetes bacterium]|nr:TonB-dependent receptor [Bacteroidota bacterium]MBU1578197.1 TonB-dependent receptor [Bacteroidota bacterium]MBU2464961.1 TonB-dependent receptor [Bacteroidota bacterium]MBU2557298.1 TonB-dependent receptor [Bacteroidota bacterium]
MFKSQYFTILLAIAFALPLAANEPPFVLHGQVLSAHEGVPYATISLAGTTTGTIADQHGHFSLETIKRPMYIIKVQSVGFKPKEIIVRGYEKKQDIIIELDKDLIGLHEVVVTANRQETNRQEAPVIVNVIGLKQINASNAVCMADGLNFQAGMRVENNCQNCGFQQVRINGLEGPYSQILIDSRPIFSALSGVYGIEQIPVAMIEKVEVVRGGGSALYGSNAIAGTINVITREPVKNSFEGAFNYALIDGTAADRNLSLNGSFVSDNRLAGINFFAVNRHRDHYDANGDGFSELGLIAGDALGFRSYFKFNSYTKLTATYHYVSEFRRGGNKFDLQPHETDITEQTDHKINGGELALERYSENLKNKFNLYTSLQHIKRESYYGAEQDPNAYGHTDDLAAVAGLQFSHKADKFLFTKAVLTTGFEYQLNQMHDQMPGYNRDLRQDITIAGFYAQSEWKVNRSSLLLGARADKHNLIDQPIISPRLTFLYDLTPNMQWRASLSTGYRAPQAFDEDLHILAVNGGVMLIQLNPNLKPEYSKSVSSSLDNYFNLFGKETNVMLEAFYTQLDDVFVLQSLETDASGNLIVERRNGSGARVYGLNLESKIAFTADNQVQFGFTWQQSRYKDAEAWSDDPNAPLLNKLLKSPDLYGYFTVNSRLSKRLLAYITGTYTGSMLVAHYAGFIPTDELKETDAFFDLNIKFALDIGKNESFSLKLEAGVQNIFNSYQSDFDFGVQRDAGYMYGPMKPRTVFIGLKVNNLL